ncbi:MAG: hypothetical protein ACK5MZ_07115 [Aestuariibaculum sp.]
MERLFKGPFVQKLSFRLLKEAFELALKSDNISEKLQAETALGIFAKNPILEKGASNISEINEHQSVVRQLMAYLFPSSLTTNEIKASIFPLTYKPFYTSKRFSNIVNQSVKTFESVFGDLFKGHGQEFDLIPYTIILNKYYDFNLDVDLPKTLKLTQKNGMTKNYRITFNADFIDIYPNENFIEITPKILDELLADAGNKAVWKKYFPENSWTLEGFGIVNMIDTSLDEAIDEFKTHLIRPKEESFQYLIRDMRTIFGIDDLQLGSYGIENNKIIPPYKKNLKMLTIDNSTTEINCKNYACHNVYEQLFVNRQPVILPNVKRYHTESKGNMLSRSLIKQGFKSVALLPITVEDKLVFVIELATYKSNQLNAINMVKLQTIIPFITSFSERSVVEHSNEISAVIQQEYTSIHPSVQWRFEEEANAYIMERNSGKTPSFGKIVFKDVYPLFGQVDIVGSSNARNKAIRQDLTKQLKQSKLLLEIRCQDKSHPFYEQLVYELDKHLIALEDHFQTNSEQEINLFFEQQIIPLFEHLRTSETHNTSDINIFLDTLDYGTHSLYEARKQYDTTVDMANKRFSAFLDEQQVKAQGAFPHYFEKFKTDGVEHNMYIGQTITKQQPFHITDLYNLRLWQLQVMCEMEAMYYQNQTDFPIQIEVASLILVYDAPLSIRYRMDEKQFDVDGAYNVRYEMIKKRIDKAHIKGTNERITQPHKLCVVYANNTVEREYLRYFEFLRAKNYVGNQIEIVELEALQGANGIKAIRVDMNYKLKQVSEIFTINDLETA